MLDLLKNPTATIKLSQIRIDGGTQMRMGLNITTVTEYAEALREGVRFPAPIVFYDGSAYWLGDGFHRVDAYTKVYGAMESIEVEVRSGTRRDAILYAAGANANHGLRRTLADKQRAVDTLLRDEEWAAWADREIARRCNVSPTFVGGRRRAIQADQQAPTDSHRTYTTKHGTMATMKTANIGKVEKKQMTLDQCIALVWRSIKHNTITIRPSERLQWLKKARMQDFWDRLTDDEAQPSDDLILRAIATVERELNGQIEHERQRQERTPAKIQEIYDRGQAAKEERGGMTKREYAVQLMPQIADWLRTYRDEHGRGWHEIADVASHSNSICWRDITKEWGARGIYYSEDVLKAAIELAILHLQQQEEELLTVHVDSDKSLSDGEVELTMSKAGTLRKEWIDHVQKTLLRMRHLRGELYAAITDDAETYDRICDDLRIMIERLEAADAERFLRAEEELANAEQRRLEEFGI